ncbi:MAG: STAS domain-containing protein [Verrucomicrobiota bacterium]
MPDNAQPVFLVHAYTDPVILKIQGRANYLNCAPVGDFFRRMIAKGKRSFVIDFAECSSMDSTFLGIMAGIALDLRTAKPPGKLVLTRLGARNLELVRNLGLHRILTLDEGESLAQLRQQAEGKSEALPEQKVQDAKALLEAHENLAEVDSSNAAQFQDVIAFLKNQIESG